MDKEDRNEDHGGKAELQRLQRQHENIKKTQTAEKMAETRKTAASTSRHRSQCRLQLLRGIFSIRKPRITWNLLTNWSMKGRTDMILDLVLSDELFFDAVVQEFSCTTEKELKSAIKHWAARMVTYLKNHEQIFMTKVILFLIMMMIMLLMLMMM